MKQFCCGRKLQRGKLSVCSRYKGFRGLVKVELDGARLVRAFSRWQKVGQKGWGMRRMMNCGGWQAGRGAQVRTGHRRVWGRSIAGHSRCGQALCLANIQVRNHDINLQCAKEKGISVPTVNIYAGIWEDDLLSQSQLVERVRMTRGCFRCSYLAKAATRLY